MAKRLESRYLPGKRSRDWLKFKAHAEQEFVIAGYTRGKGRRSGGFGSLVLAVYGNEGLEYVGNVGTGFDDAEIERLLKLLRPLERKDSPFAQVPKLPRVRKDDIVWVEPKLVAEVVVRRVDARRPPARPVYTGLRDDKSPDEVRRELPGEQP